MTHKLCLYISFIFLFVHSYGQNKQILYGFDELPQTLMLNPGAEINFNKHISIPFTNNFFQVGATNKNFTYNNINAGSGGANQKFRNIYEQNLSNNDYFILNQRLEILNAGFRLRNQNFYLSFGIYEEMDGFGLYPKEIVELYFEGDDKNGDGIPEFNEETNLNEFNYTGEFIGVFHVGITNKINERLTIGARLKLISGSLSFNSTNNTGKYSLTKGNFGFVHNFNGTNIKAHSSGFADLSGKSATDIITDNLSGLFFGNGNLGFGIDLGATYNVTDKISISASFLDLDYINYSNETITNVIAQDFTIEDDTYFNPPPGDELNYWEDKITVYYNAGEIPLDTLQIGFNVYRSPKINTAVKYTLTGKGKTENSAFRNVRCDKCNTQDDILTSEVGVQTYTIFRPDKIGWAITGYYAKEFSRYLQAKITYTYDNFSPYNIGLGISTHINNFNLYATADNLLNLPKLKNSNYQSIQFGMNFIFN